MLHAESSTVIAVSGPIYYNYYSETTPSPKTTPPDVTLADHRETTLLPAGGQIRILG